MTEDEARLKACCGGEGCGYVNPTDNQRYCIGSACMAWRWEDEAEEVATARKCEVCKGSGVVVTGSGETAGGEECNACVGGYQTEAVQIGFCGLAGQP